MFKFFKNVFKVVLKSFGTLQSLILRLVIGVQMHLERVTVVTFSPQDLLHSLGTMLNLIFGKIKEVEFRATRRADEGDVYGVLFSDLFLP
jgi:hypothetical protein